MRSVRIVLALAVALLLAYPALAAPEKSGQEGRGVFRRQDECRDARGDEGFQGRIPGNAGRSRARLAIFNGDPKVAVKMMGKAKKALDAATKDESMFVADMKTLAGNKAAHGTTSTSSSATPATTWIPIDGQISLADTYVATPEKTEHIAKANEHFKSGRAKEAVEELRLGEIDVTYSRVMMPLTATTKCLADAMQLADEHKYYEANLSLKAAEDGVIVDSVGLADVPQDKGGSKEVAKKTSSGEKKLK